MTITPPPPVISAGRVLAYAVVDDSIHFTGQQTLCVAGRPIGAMPCIALCEALDDSGGGFFVAYCNASWEAVGMIPATDPDSALRQIDQYYHGIRRLWTHTAVTLHQALEWMTQGTSRVECSFCGRRSAEVSKMIRSHSATICNLCIDALYADAHARP